MGNHSLTSVSEFSHFLVGRGWTILVVNTQFGLFLANPLRLLKKPDKDTHTDTDRDTLFRATHP